MCQLVISLPQFAFFWFIVVVENLSFHIKNGSGDCECLESCSANYFEGFYIEKPIREQLISSTFGKKRK